MSKNLTVKQSLLWILISTVIVSGSSFSIFFGVLSWRKKQLKDHTLRIAAIIQTGPEKEALPSQYLAELMHLSLDRKTNYYAFNERRAEENLLRSPFIKEAKVKKVRPNAVYVDYTKRSPIALLIDYENVAIDEDGYVFPIEPFYQVENLVELYLGLPPFNDPLDEQQREGGSYKKAIQCKHFALAKKILSLLNEKEFVDRFTLKKIDVSKSFSPSFGQREVVISLDEHLEITQKELTSTFILPKYLRLNVKQYHQQLSNFLVLSQKMRNDYRLQIHLTQDMPDVIRCKPKLLDFRIPQLAFIKENE
ncbi:MAG: FtsQ-type POTRA domain-containing protein [Chlamydiota bacterium]|jgi:hypothetical protein